MRSIGLCPALLAAALCNTFSTTATAAPVPSHPVRGTVFAADGTPAAGAIVWAATFTHGPLVRHETVADAAGRYSLALPPGNWYLWSRQDTQGGEVPDQRFQVVAGNAPMEVTIRLEERGTLRGRLLEAETSKPIPHGRLFLDAGFVLTADEDGRFRVGGLSRTNHEAFVVAPGRMRMRVLFDTTGKADTELDVPVPRGGKIVGLVTDADGKPIPGAHVGRPTSGSFFSINGLYQACAADGRFEYDDAVPPDQPSDLTATAPGYEENELSDLIPSAPGKPIEVQFKLRPKPHAKADPKAPPDGRRVVSGVVRGPDRKPVAGVLVLWGDQQYVGATQTRTDAEGRFRMTVADKADALAVLSREYAPQFPNVEAGGDQTLEISLADGHAARGRVTDSDGKPIRDAQVIPVIASPIPGIGNPYWLTEAAARTDAEGRFNVKGVPDGARFDFLKTGLSDLRNQSLQVDGADNSVTMVHVGAVGGKVVDQNGKPIRSFRVLVGFPQERKPGEQTQGCFAGYSGIGVRFTSPDGTFVLTGVGAYSVYRITVQAEGCGGAVVDRVTAVPANVLAGPAPVVFRLGPPTALSVRAIAGGKPVTGALVTLVNGQPGLDRSFMWGYHNASWEQMIRCRTDAGGVAEFAALQFGEATVLVQSPGFARQRIGWRNGQKDLTIELAPEAVLTGEVRDAAGWLVKSCFINVSSGGDQVDATVRPDDKGRFRIAELPAGAWSVNIRAADGRTQLYSGQITLKSGESKELSVDATGQ